MPTSLVKQVADYCWSHDFLSVFRKFFADHASAFDGAPDMCSGEHNLEYYALFEKYLRVYEDALTEYVTSLNCTIEEFYKEVREYQADTSDSYILLFIDCLLASADYESFYKVMVKESRKKQKAASLKVTDIQVQADEKRSSKETDDDADVKEVYADSKAEGKESK